VKKISQIPRLERPREKLKLFGPRTLSDSELMAVLLGSGSGKHSVLELSGRVVRMIDESRGRPELDKLLSVEGIGLAKAAVISAALEFGRRRIRPEGVKVVIPTQVLPIIQHFADRKQEHLLCISLSGAGEVIACRVVTIGLVDRTQVHPREVFADPIIDRASAVIIAHNHPMGPLEPSSEDREITRRIKAAGNALGIWLLDHIIFNQKGYYSFMEHDEMGDR
jgi:DNA repair protein RadC